MLHMDAQMAQAESTIRVAPYILIPHNLCADVRDNPIAVGVYALIARLYFVAHTPIPLSAGDLERFDQQISYGQARRALDRLTESGWLIASALGRKNAYLPTWGNIQGTPRPWNIAAEKLGRPPHVRCEKLASEQLDQIAYVTPHPRLPAIIKLGASSATLAHIGLQLLSALHLAPVASEASPPTPALFCCTAELIDQPIPHLIGSTSTQEVCFEASECAGVRCETTPLPIPWTLGHEVINQQATLLTKHETVEAQPDDGVQILLDSNLKRDDSVAQAHLLLNPQRTIAPGEWLELHDLQQEHGSARMLIWQARAARRRAPIVQITPDYYRACALRDLVDAGQSATYRSMDPCEQTSELSISPSAASNIRNRCLPTGHLADQLHMLGINVLSGLADLAPELVGQWVAASKHPDWAQIWDDPGGAARTLLLRNQAPPSSEVIIRRAAARKRTEPVDWATLAATSAGMARFGDDLSGLEQEAADSYPPTPDDGVETVQSLDTAEELAEQLRMALRLHAPTRPAFQAIERLQVDQTNEQVLVSPGRLEDMPFLRNLLPVMLRALDGYTVVLQQPQQ